MTKFLQILYSIFTCCVISFYFSHKFKLFCTQIISFKDLKSQIHKKKFFFMLAVCNLYWDNFVHHFSFDLSPTKRFQFFGKVMTEWIMQSIYFNLLRQCFYASKQSFRSSSVWQNKKLKNWNETHSHRFSESYLSRCSECFDLVHNIYVADCQTILFFIYMRQDLFVSFKYRREFVTFAYPSLRTLRKYARITSLLRTHDWLFFIP